MTELLSSNCKKNNQEAEFFYYKIEIRTEQRKQKWDSYQILPSFQNDA